MQDEPLPNEQHNGAKGSPLSDKHMILAIPHNMSARIRWPKEMHNKLWYGKGRVQARKLGWLTSRKSFVGPCSYLEPKR